MAVKRLLTLLLLVSVDVGLCVAQDVPVLTATDLPSGKIIKTEYYSGKALFGYIDGGAELYLEYGFQKLSRQEIRCSGETVVAEIYEMGGAYEAFGIFSIQRFKCIAVDSASPNTCQSRYQLQAVVGNCYLSVVNESGTPGAQQASVGIYRSIKAKVKPHELPLPALFRTPGLGKYSCRLMVIRGTLGIQNGFSEWESLFQGIPRFSLAVLPIELGPEHLTLAHIGFLTTREQLEFCRLAGFNGVNVGAIAKVESNGLIRILKRESESEILFVESTLLFPERDSFFRYLEN